MTRGFCWSLVFPGLQCSLPLQMSINVETLTDMLNHNLSRLANLRMPDMIKKSVKTFEKYLKQIFHTSDKFVFCHF